MDPNSCHQENLAVPLSSLNRSFNCYWRIFLRIRDKMQVEGGGEGGLETLVYQKQCINGKATVSLTKFQKCITGRYVHLRYLLITIFTHQC